MSIKREIRSRSSLLSVSLDRCKRIVERYLRERRKAMLSAADGGENDPYEVGSLTNGQDGLPVNLGEDRMGFDEFLKSLSIGDRIRVLCEDGVLVAEKVSQTQFELVDSQVLARFIH
jgi:hypothetical protein